MFTKIISFKTDPVFAKEVKRFAKIRDETLSEFIRQAVETAIKNEKEKLMLNLKM